MSTITECIESSIAVSSGSATQLKALAPFNTPSMAATTIDYARHLMDGGSAAMTAGYVDHFVGLLGASIAVTARALPKLTIKDLLAVRASVRADLENLVHQVAAAQISVASSTFTARLTGIVAASALSIAVTPVAPSGGQRFTTLVSTGMAMRAAIDLRVLELAHAALAMAASVQQHAHQKDHAAAAALAMSAAQVVQGLTLRQLAAAQAVTMAANALALLHVTQLAGARLTIGAAAVDRKDTTSAWTAPTDTMAMSRYTLPALAGVTSGAGVTVLIGPDGLFLRGGIDDDGLPIDMAVKSGLMDFKSEAIKNADDLYLAFKSTRGLIVDVGETSSGAEQTYSFPSDVIAASELVPWRIQVDRGIESRYRRYTIRNVDGDVLSIRGFLAVLNDMKRRF